MKSTIETLLTQWGDALLEYQSNHPSPELNGGLLCPACARVHGRSADSVYPFMALARLTGDCRYMDAAIRVVRWSRKVSRPDGAWICDVNINPWHGITVFGATALAEALKHHGSLLDNRSRHAWFDRLGRAADYLYEQFTPHRYPVNYALALPYALELCAQVLERPRYRERARRLAHSANRFITQHDGLLFGEGHPRDGRSPMDRLPVDLGYNVEESIPALLQYGELADDPEIRTLATDLMRRHLLFLLPDGGWDNSWGTRNFKWTYWGSRTSDGALYALVALSGTDAVFAAAAGQHLDLLCRCTADGLLYGGPHLHVHGAPPCLQHTIFHAKPLAAILDHRAAAESDPVPEHTELPRLQAPAWHWLRDLRTGLIRHHGWMATFTAYDWMYRHDTHTTGGMLSLLWHRDTGPLVAAGLSRDQAIEPHNMQQNLDAATAHPSPRLEVVDEGMASHYDGAAELSTVAADGVITVTATGQLLTGTGDTRKRDDAGTYRIRYRFDHSSIRIRIETSEQRTVRWFFPLISERTESVSRPHARALEIHKPDALVQVTASVPIEPIGDTTPSRALCQPPGFEVLPLQITAEAPHDGLEMVISVHRHAHV